MSASAILKLQKAGFTSEQVEALADFMDTQAASKADLVGETSAIRSDLERVEHKLDMKIAEVKADVAGVKSDLRLVENGLRAEMKQIEQRMTIKLGGMIVVAVGVLMAAMRYFTIH